MVVTEDVWERNESVLVPPSLLQSVALGQVAKAQWSTQSLQTPPTIQSAPGTLIVSLVLTFVFSS